MHISVFIVTVLLGAVFGCATPTLPNHTYTTGNTTSTGTYVIDGSVFDASFKGVCGVAYDANAGGLVVADCYANNIRRIDDATYTVTSFAGSATDTSGMSNAQGSEAKFYFPAGCTVTSTGITFVGDSLNHQIREITSGGTVTLLAGASAGTSGSTDATGSSAAFYSPYGVAAYTTTTVYVADTYNNKIRAVATADGATTTLAGSGVWNIGSAGTDAVGAAATFAMPHGVSVYSTAVYVADTYSHSIRKVLMSDGTTTTLAGSGSAGSSDATGASASFDRPIDVSVDGNGYVFVADNLNDKIRIVSSVGVTTTAAVAVNLTGHPMSIDVTVSGDVYFGEYLVAVTAKVHAFTGAVAATTNVPATPSPPTTATPPTTTTPTTTATPPTTTAAPITATPVTDSPSASTPTLPAHSYTTGSSYGGTSTTASYGYVNGHVTLAKFTGPWGVAYDNTTSDVVLADYFDDRIRRISALGDVTTFAGSGSAGSTDGTGPAASFYYPAGCSVSSAGVSFVADKSNHAIRQISATGVVTTFAGAGTSGFVDATGTAAKFASPHGVVVAGTTAVYVADSWNNRVRKLATADGAATTHAGSGTYGLLDGFPVACKFKYPFGISLSSTGVVYIADSGSHTIRKVATDGFTSTLAGNGAAGTADATGAAASFSTPYDVSVNADGFVFVADSTNNQIRIVSPGGVTTTASTASLSSPRGVHVTGAGHVYIGNFNSEKLMAYTGSTLAPTPSPSTATPDTTAVPAPVSQAAGLLAAAPLIATLLFFVW
jgi:sugar lactone lactonase YvrE